MTRRRFLALAGLSPIVLAACGQTLGGQSGQASGSSGSAASSAISKATASIAATLSPEQGKLAVFNTGSKDVSVIDALKNEVVETKPLGASVRWLDNEQDFWDGKHIWTYDFPSNKLEVISIDPTDWQVSSKVNVGTGPGHSVILSKDAKTATINVAGDNKLAQINTADASLIKTADVGKFPCDLDNSADFKYLYTPERDQDTVAMFDAATLNLVKRVNFPAGTKPHMLRVSPDGKTVWVQTASGGTNVVLDATDLSTLATEKSGKTPVTNTWSPDGQWALVTNSGDGTITLFNAKTYKPVRTISVGQGPSTVTYRKDGKFAYVAVTSANVIAVVDTGTWEVAKTIKVGQGPQGLILLP